MEHGKNNARHLVHFLQGPRWRCSWFTEAQRSRVTCLCSQSRSGSPDAGLFFLTMMSTWGELLGLTATLNRVSWNVTSWARILETEVLFLKS